MISSFPINNPQIQFIRKFEYYTIPTKKIQTPLALPSVHIVTYFTLPFSRRGRCRCSESRIQYITYDLSCIHVIIFSLFVVCCSVFLDRLTLLRYFSPLLSVLSIHSQLSLFIFRVEPNFRALCLPRTQWTEFRTSFPQEYHFCTEALVGWKWSRPNYCPMGS